MKTFKDFISEVKGHGGSPGQEYINPFRRPGEYSPPPPGFREKYIDPLKKVKPPGNSQVQGA